MSDFEFREENTIEAVFSMEVGREMNDHNKLYNRYADDQHPISAITGLIEALAEGSSNLQAEISRAEAAEQALDYKIEAETTRAEGVESGLNTAISNETSARQQADTTLQNNITAEENRAKGIENGLLSDLTAETTARQDADTGLQNQISTNASDITALQNGKADKSTTYTKTEVDTALNNKADKSTTYTKTEVDTIATGKANVGLDNLNADGQMIIDSVNGCISNCILEIPQNINVTIENNVLTLKSGSILTRTGKTYATETTVNDLTYTFQSSLGDGRFVVLGNSSGLGTPRKINNVYSGNSSQYPTTGLTSTTIYFNTDDKLIYIPNNDFSAWNTWSVAYPLAIVDVANGVASFAKDSNGNDMIFNGAGFIGHHAFVYPNVKALNPDGIDTNGTLKSKEITISSLVIAEMQTNNRTITISSATAVQRRSGYSEVQKYDSQIQGAQYIIPQNIIIFNNLVRNETPFIFITYNGTTVTQFDIRQPYEGARDLLTDEIKEEVATKQVDVTTLTGYDSTQTQTLKNINGVLQWVTD